MLTSQKLQVSPHFNMYLVIKKYMTVLILTYLTIISITIHLQIYIFLVISMWFNIGAFSWCTADPSWNIWRTSQLIHISLRATFFWYIIQVVCMTLQVQAGLDLPLSWFWMLSADTENVWTRDRSVVRLLLQKEMHKKKSLPQAHMATVTSILQAARDVFNNLVSTQPTLC